MSWDRTPALWALTWAHCTQEGMLFRGRKRAAKSQLSAMAGKPLDIHPAALAELKSAVSWYEERSASAGCPTFRGQRGIPQLDAFRVC